ncbi:MAG: glycosyltransferase [Candidatus Bathyarchaeota archaeon]|nr:glycosyltransferase [Candidatus Bathyarchaeum tardum]
MRVGVFQPTFNVYGGGEFVAASIANTLAKNGHEVILFTNEKINQTETKNFLGQRLHSSIKNLVPPSPIQPKTLMDFYANFFRSFILKLKTDIWVDVYSCCLFPWTNISYIHFPFLNSDNYKPNFPYLKRPFILQTGALPYVFFEKNLFTSNGKLVIANSKFTADEIEKNSGTASTVLYPPIHSCFFNDKKTKISKKQEKNLVVTVSRFDPAKGLEIIPYIASLTDDNIHFAIIGRLHHKKTLLSLQKLIKKLGLSNRVKLYPNISRSELKKILETAKIYLHTKKGEHFGISIVEGMAMGCVPVVHASGGTKEFVPDHLRYQTLFEAAEIITREVLDWSPQKTMESIKTAEKFNEENFADNFLKLFNKYIYVNKNFY